MQSCSSLAMLHRCATRCSSATACKHMFASIRNARTGRKHTSVFAGKGLAELLSVSGVGKSKARSGRPRVEKGIVSPIISVPDHIPKPSWYYDGKAPDFNDRPEIHDAEGIAKMRAACKLAAQVLQFAGSLVKPGVTTDEIDRAVHQMIVDNGAYPSTVNYGEFPKSCCTSINEVMCHGIPDSRALTEGDIINIDITVWLNGYHGDNSCMFMVGDVSDRAKRVCKATKEAMETAIKECGPGVPFRRVGQAVSSVADRYKLRVVEDFVGHGVGKVFHAAPAVLHHRNIQPGKMQVGQTFTIEPILCESNARPRYWKDKWTAVAPDGALSAQYEHTILITENGYEILTLP